MKKVLLILLAACSFSGSFAQADPAVASIISNPGTIQLGGTTVIEATLVNLGGTDVLTNTLRLQITVPANATITGLAAGSDSKWTVFSLGVGNANTIQVRNTGGTLIAGDGALIRITAVGTLVGGPSTYSGFLSYIPPGLPAQANDNTNDNGTSQLTVASVVPVKFNDISTEASDCNAKLKWSTSLEEGASNFDVEYSPDGRNFIKVAVVPVKGISTGASYEYAYPQGNGKGYYRLKMSNASGGYSYSKIVTANITCNVKKVFLYPNPVSISQILHVNVSNYEGVVKGELINEKGQVVLSNTLRNGTNDVPLMKLPQGTYNFKVFDDNKEMQTYKVVIVK